MRRTSPGIFVVIAVIGSMLAGGIGRPQPALAADSAPLGQFIELDETTIGPNRAVSGIGKIGFVGNCAVHGARDFIYPFAKAFVTSTGVTAGEQLSDVSGAPNVVVGASGGVFIETLGYTKPSGNLGPGSYAIVFDECQDGRYDAGIDAVFDPAFRVVIPTDVSSLPAAAFAQVKSDARLQAEKLLELHKDAFAYLAVLSSLELANLIDPTAALLYVLTFTVEGLLHVNPKIIALDTLFNLVRHYGAIAADPPDPDFDQITTLAGRKALEPQSDDPVVRAISSIGPTAEAQDAAVEALLGSVERYQGADAAGDGEWALVHGRAIIDHSALIRTGLAHENAALATIDSAIAADTRGIEEAAASLESFRTRVREQGFAPEEVRVARNAGLTDNEIGALRHVFIRQSLALQKTELRSNLAALRSANDQAAAHLDEFSSSMADIVSGLEDDPDVPDETPTAIAGGPYASAEGSPVAFAATGSGGTGALSFAWDLDGDGAFDDAASASASRSYDHPFRGLVGVRVTDAAGPSNVAYAPIEITETNRTPVATALTPEPRLVTAMAGQATGFSVTPSDPEDDAVTVRWLVDDQEAVTGTQFSFVPGLDDVGGHPITALVSDAGGSTRYEWLANVVRPDLDGDLWNANVDCDDNDPSRNPGLADVANGIDDDCDSTTPDGGDPPQVDAGPDLTATEGQFARLQGTFTHSDMSFNFPVSVNWGDGTTSERLTGPAAGTLDDGHAYRDEGDFIVSVCVSERAGARACDETRISVANVPPAVDAADNLGLDPPRILEGGSYTQVAEIEDPGADDVLSGTVNWDDGSTDDRLLGPPPNVPQQALGYASSGWRYREVPHGEGPADFASPEFVESSFSEGTAGFGRACGDLPSGTEWNIQTDMLVRHDVELLGSAFDVVVHVAIDNDVQLFWNGTDISQGFIRSGGCARRDQASVIVPSGLLRPGRNVLAARAHDHGGVDYFDARVSYRWSGWVQTHVYGDDRTYTVNVCADDGDGGAACDPAQVNVFNVPPVVDAGPDLRVNSAAGIEVATFTDPGFLDTHTATIEWGDGSVEPRPVTEERGSGTLEGNHVYALPGEYTAQVCVTDDEGGRGCDSLLVTATAAAPPETQTQDVAGEEGLPLALPFAFADPNPDDTFTASVEWGDGSPVEQAAIATSVGGFGSGFVQHAYAEQGAYQVNVTVCDQTARCDGAAATAAVANLPPAALPDAATLDEDAPAVIDVLSNDGDVPADMPLRVSGVGPASIGAVSTDGSSVTYVPNPNANGFDSFTYTVDDGDGGRATSIVTLNVRPVNDAPSATGDAFSLTEDDPRALLDVLRNDADLDGDPVLLEAVVQDPGHGTATVDGGVISYVPAPDFCGTDSLGYRIADPGGLTDTAEVRLTIGCVNDAPVVSDDHLQTDPYTELNGNVLDNDTDVDEERPVLESLAQGPAMGTVDLRSDGSFTYTPDPAEFSGQDKFVYRACDLAGACDFATVFIDDVHCEEGLDVLEGTIVHGAASEVVHDEIERRIARFNPALAKAIHDANCSVVVPVEETINGGS